MKIDKRCFKIDKTNAKAMIEGYTLGGKLIRQAIWCDVFSKPFPMLMKQGTYIMGGSSLLLTHK